MIQNRGYFKNLDGLHFFAALAVICAHYLTWIVAFGLQACSGLPSHTIGSFQDLAFGGLLAFFCLNYKTEILKFYGQKRQALYIAFYAFGFLVFIARYQINLRIPIYEALYRPVHTLIFCWVILDQGFNPKPVFSMSKIPLIPYLGKITYGLYLLHPIALLLVKVFWLNVLIPMLVLPAVLMLSVGLASASYHLHLYESFFLRLITQFS